MQDLLLKVHAIPAHEKQGVLPPINMMARVPMDLIYFVFQFPKTLLHYVQQSVTRRAQPLKVIVFVDFGWCNWRARRRQTLVELLVQLPRDWRQLRVEAGVAETAVFVDVVGENGMGDVVLSDDFAFSVRDADFERHDRKGLGVRSKRVDGGG